MNNKAQAGPVGFIFVYIFFVINWFLWLGNFLNMVGNNAIISAGLTGIEAFFFSNLNYVVFIGMTLGIIGYTYFASG